MRRALPWIAAGISACGGFQQPEPDATLFPRSALIGRIDMGLRPAGSPDVEVDLFVDGETRHVFVTPDGTFNVKELPDDQAAVEVMLDDARATMVELTGLRPGELILLELRASAAEMHVETLERPTELRDYHLPVRRSGALELLESDAVFYLDPGDYPGGIDIRGHRVKVFAINQDEPCETRPRAQFTGDITVRGDDVEIFDLATQGQVRLGGSRIRVFSPCDDLWITDTSPALIDNGGITVGPSGIL
jgi:hypothetical protein